MIRKLIAIGTLAALAATIAAPAALAKGDKAPGEATIYDIVETFANGATPEFTYLKAALDATGLDAALDMEGVQYTVFAPTDAAFEKVADELLAEAGLGDGTVPTLLGYLLATDLADDVLLYHVADGRRFSNSVVNRNNDKEIETLLGASLWSTPAAELVDAAPSTSDAQILAPSLANISASNGVIHVIDNVLVPLDI
jgi:uncharacterized surface protein with fasciclin (FAS1) repeats